MKSYDGWMCFVWTYCCYHMPGRLSGLSVCLLLLCRCSGPGFCFASARALFPIMRCTTHFVFVPHRAFLCKHIRHARKRETAPEGSLRVC